MVKVLVYTSLFPNQIKTDLGVFIKKRMAAYAKRNNCELRVIAPVPYFPKTSLFKTYSYFSHIPQREIIDDILVYHPRYPLIPKISMPFHGQLMYHGTKNLVRHLYKTFRFDIIDAHFIFPDCQAAVAFGNMLHVPVVSSARGSDINEFLYYPLIKPQIIKTLQKTTQIISVCQALKNMMIALGIEDEKISVIPNGVDTTLFYLTDRQKALEKSGIDANKKNILSVGSLIPRKSHDLTIKAVSRLINKGYKINLYILGTGPEKKNLEKLIDKLNLRKYVFLKGHIPNETLNLWYNAADFFCLSSAREGWANVLTESLACGTPVVATNVFGASEIVKNDSLGILINRTYDDIAQGLEDALNKSWNRKKISETISTRTWDVVAEEVSGVFDQALNQFHQ